MMTVRLEMAEGVSQDLNQDIAMPISDKIRRRLLVRVGVEIVDYHFLLRTQKKKPEGFS